MKRLSFLLALVLFSLHIYAQEERIANKQFMLGCTNVGSSEQVTHYINAAGEVWQYSGGSFITGGVNNNSFVTIGNANFQSPDWPGFNFSWLDTIFTMPRWSLGFYKVTNSKQTDKYFYLDARDSDFGAAVYNPDFWIYFDNSSSVYRYRSNNEAIPQGDVVRVWNIHEESPNTSGLQNFWSNALVLVNNGSNRPQLIWGKYPTSSVVYYLIYRDESGGGNFTHIATVNNSTYTYTDNSVTISQQGQTIYYKVKPLGKEFTNTVSTTVIPFKINTELESEINYSLSQNFPNPFNPNTEISYSVAENSFISLKVYDVLGNEISELVSEIKEPGIYSVSFDASQLSSGIYFYTLKANGYSLTKKMLLAK